MTYSPKEKSVIVKICDIFVAREEWNKEKERVQFSSGGSADITKEMFLLLCK